jgi:hypothetical protein
MFARCAILIPLCAVLGCGTASPTKVVSPRVTGRVVDARTREPIANITVQRQSGRHTHRLVDPPKGGELMKQPPVVRTDAQGNFILHSERDLTIFRGSTWFSVNLLFEHPHYQRYVASYHPIQATNNPTTGEPLITTGDVSLVPKANRVTSRF